MDRLHDFAHVREVVPDQLRDALVARVLVKSFSNSFDGGELMVGLTSHPDVVDPGRDGLCRELA